MLRSLFTLAVVFLAPLAAFAHGMSVDVTVKGGEVTVEVYYSDDTPGSGVPVKVFNTTKEVVLEGTTDEKGKWSFPAPSPGEYSVRAKTDDGHAARQSFTVTADPPPADAETPTGFRPPRLLLLGIGLLVLTVGFNLWYWLGRRKRTPPPPG